jgi:hypothetical protein
VPDQFQTKLITFEILVALLLEKPVCPAVYRQVVTLLVGTDAAKILDDKDCGDSEAVFTELGTRVADIEELIPVDAPGTMSFSKSHGLNIR